MFDNQNGECNTWRRRCFGLQRSLQIDWEVTSLNNEKAIVWDFSKYTLHSEHRQSLVTCLAICWWWPAPPPLWPALAATSHSLQLFHLRDVTADLDPPRPLTAEMSTKNNWLSFSARYPQWKPILELHFLLSCHWGLLCQSPLNRWIKSKGTILWFFMYYDFSGIGPVGSKRRLIK